MNSPRCIAAQNGCTTSETMRLLNSINNTPISECCDDRANRRIGLCDRPAEAWVPGREDGVALAMLVPGLAATIALAGASHGALLDHACSGHAGVLAASQQYRA
jgi:hypothetical protein